MLDVKNTASLYILHKYFRFYSLKNPCIGKKYAYTYIKRYFFADFALS